MVYTSNSPLKKVPHNKFRGKLKTLSQNQQKRLKKHRDVHTGKNPRDTINKHMRVMRDLMKQGKSFKFAHEQAQKKYPISS